MKEKQFITVVGDISPGQKVYSGQIAKVRDYYHYLKIYFGEENVNIIDTSNWRRTLPAVARKLLYSCSHSENIVLMLCGNGRKTILPLVMALKEIYKFNVFFPAIGDVQSVYDDEPFLRSALKKMDGIYFETNRMVDFFKNKGYENAKYMPVFSKRVFHGDYEISRHYDEPFRLCTYSRVCEEKGISDAIDAVIEVNKHLGRVACILDIFGPPAEDFKKEFEDRVAKAGGCVVNRGLLTDSDAINVLSEHYLMLFPTWWKGEGFPIALIECYKAGLPIIATDWNFNSEIIHDGITGRIYPPHDNDALVRIITELIDDQEAVYNMKLNCLKEAEKYAPETIMRELYRDIELCSSKQPSIEPSRRKESKTDKIVSDLESSEMKTAVIFGAGSFIGKNLIKELYRDYRLILIESDLKYVQDVLSVVENSNIELKEFQFNPETPFDELLSSGDIVIHLESSTNPTTSNMDISKELSDNVLSSARLFDACVKQNIKKVIFISSGGTVYGKNVQCPISEDAQADPINSYGLQKLTIEKMLYVYHMMYGLEYRIARLSNPYGPYQRPNGKQGVVTTFLYYALLDKEINVFGDGSVVRDFIYIDDAVKAIRNLIEGNCKHRIYNIGSGTGVSIKEILSIIKCEVGKEIVVNFGESRKVDVPKNYLDIDRYNLEFQEGTCLTNLVDGIHLTREFLESKICIKK